MRIFWLAVILPVALLAITVLLVGLASRRSRFVERWADAHGLDLTDRTRPMVTHYLRTSRQLRLLGAVAGLVLPVPVAAALGWGTNGAPGGLTTIIVGYLVGALYAEVALGRPLAGSGRSASLVPRELDAYLPAFLRTGQRILGGAAVMAGIAVAVVPFDPGGVGQLSDAVALTLGALGAGGAVGLEASQRWIVSRPQPLVAEDLLRSDDAIRSQSILSLAGAGTAALLLLVGNLLWQLALSDVQLLRWTAWLPALACWCVAVTCWSTFGHMPWRVVRNSTPSPAAQR